MPGHSSATHKCGGHEAVRPPQLAGLNQMRRPAPAGGVMPLSPSSPRLPCPNLTPPPVTGGSESHRFASRRTPGSTVCGRRRPGRYWCLDDGRSAGTCPGWEHLPDIGPRIRPSQQPLRRGMRLKAGFTFIRCAGAGSVDENGVSDGDLAEDEVLVDVGGADAPMACRVGRYRR